MENSPPKKNRFSSLMVFLASLLWATDGPFRKPLLVGGLGAGFVSFLEHGLNTLASLPGLVKNRAQFRTVSKAQWVGLLYIGAGASALGALLFVKGAVAMNYNFTVAALLQKFQPLFAILLAMVFLKEKLSKRFLLLIVPALCGGYLVTFGAVSPISLFQSAGQVSLLGPSLAIGAALLWAGGTVVGKGLMQSLNLQFVNSMRFIFGFLFLLVYVLMFEHFQFVQMTPIFWVYVLAISMLTGFFALLLYYYGLKGTKASVATLLELGYPLALTVVNWKFLGITLTMWQIVGALVLLASVTTVILMENQETEHIHMEKK